MDMAPLQRLNRPYLLRIRPNWRGWWTYLDHASVASRCAAPSPWGSWSACSTAAPRSPSRCNATLHLDKHHIDQVTLLIVAVNIGSYDVYRWIGSWVGVHLKELWWLTHMELIHLLDLLVYSIYSIQQMLRLKESAAHTYLKYIRFYIQ